jgi:hypothetical protein
MWRRWLEPKRKMIEQRLRNKNPARAAGPPAAISIPLFEIVQCRRLSHRSHDIVSAFKREFCQSTAKAAARSRDQPVASELLFQRCGE